MNKVRNPFIKALPWLFLPTLAIFLIGSFFMLNFRWFADYFMSTSPTFRIVLFFAELACYLIVVLIHNNRRS